MQSRALKNWSHPHAWKLFCSARCFILPYICIVFQLKQELQSDVRTPQMEDEPPTGDDDGPNWTPEKIDGAYQKLGEDTTNNSQTTKPKCTH